jgi:hypothetical protein
MDDLDQLLDQLIENQEYLRDVAIAIYQRFGGDELGIEVLKSTMIVEALLRYKEQGGLKQPSSTLPAVAGVAR